jgi:hemerythrin-like domain-containing protein
MTPIDDTPEGLRARLARDHRELENLFQELTSALRADAREDTLRLWTAFDDGLCRHMALEETHILPLLQLHHAREVSELSQEHDEIRKQLAELGVSVDLHEIPFQTVEQFIERLRQHARREDALAYRWAEANLPASQQERIGGSLGAASALQQRLLELGRKVKARVAAGR